MVTKRDFKIGADPEFAFTSATGKYRTPYNLVQDTEQDAAFGLDGSGDVAEIRPDPSTDPRKVVSSIRSALCSGLEQYPKAAEYQWRGGSSVEGVPTGGHIHFGVRDLWPKNGRGPGLFEIMACLDAYLAPALLLLEKPAEARERRFSYGGLGDYRVQPHGFEYRAPSSWLTSPYIALGALSWAKVVVWDAFFHGLTNEAVKHPPDQETFQYLGDGSDAYFRSHYKNVIRPAIQKMELYPKFKAPIDLIDTLIQANKNWFPKGADGKEIDMKEAWGVSADAVVAEGRKLSLAELWRGVRA